MALQAPAGLTPGQLEAFTSFTEITSWTDDPSLAVVLLSSVDWNVEAAVMAHFDGSAPAPPVVSPVVPPRSSTASTASVLIEDPEEDLERDLAPRVANPSGGTVSAGPNGFSGFSIMQAILFAPFKVGFKAFNTVMYFLAWMFPVLPRLTGYYPANRTATHTGSESGDYATNAAARFIRSFEEVYGPKIPEGTKVPFFLGGYTAALEKAKAELKYLVVVLQTEEHDYTTEFNSKVLLAPQVLELLSRDDILLWAGNVQESEAYQVASGLGVTKFPFCALVAPSPRSPTSPVLVMSVLARIQGAGALHPGEFVSTIEDKMETHTPKIYSLVLDRQEREATRQIRQQQESAYEHSLAVDRERQRQAEEAAQRAQSEEQERRHKEEQALLLEQKKAQWIRWRRQELVKKTEANAEAPSTRVSIRLPSGERVIEKFADSTTLDDLYAFVQVRIAEGAGNESGETTAPSDYTHEYPFKIVCPIPRAVFEPLDSPIRDQPKLWPNGSIVVEMDQYDEE